MYFANIFPHLLSWRINRYCVEVVRNGGGGVNLRQLSPENLGDPMTTPKLFTLWSCWPLSERERKWEQTATKKLMSNRTATPSPKNLLTLVLVYNKKTKNSQHVSGLLTTYTFWEEEKILGASKTHLIFSLFLFWTNTSIIFYFYFLGLVLSLEFQYLNSKLWVS